MNESRTVVCKYPSVTYRFLIVIASSFKIRRSNTVFENI